MGLTRITCAAVVVVLAAVTGCTSGGGDDDKPPAKQPAATLPGLNTKTLETHVARAGWKLTYRNLDTKGHPADRLRQGSGAGQGKQRIGVMENGALPRTMTAVTCQSVGKDQDAAQDFLTACAGAPIKRAEHGTVKGWLGDHLDRVSRGTGHRLTRGPVTYHLAVSAKRDLFVLNMTPAVPN